MTAIIHTIVDVTDVTSPTQEEVLGSIPSDVANVNRSRPSLMVPNLVARRGSGSPHLDMTCQINDFLNIIDSAMVVAAMVPGRESVDPDGRHRQVVAQQISR